METNQSNKNHVLLWSPFGSGEHYNGPAKYTYRVYSKIAPAPWRVSLAHGSKDQDDQELFENHYAIGQASGKLATLQFVRNGKSWIEKNSKQFDLFHGVSDYHCTVPVAYRAKQLGLPVVLFVSIQPSGLASKGGIAGLLGVYRNRQKMAKTFDAIIAMSSEIESELLSIGIRQQNIFRIPNFADTSLYHPVGNTEKQRLRGDMNLKDRPTVVFVGRLCPRKRPHLILEAIRSIRQKNFDAQAVFVGPYDDNDEYIKKMFAYSKENGLEDHLIYTGFTNEVDKWLKCADVFCLPSISEGMPGAMIEAMACGLPAVVSPFSSAKDLISFDLFGQVLSPAATADDLADALLHYFDRYNQSVDFEQRGDFIQQHYSLDAVSKMYSDLMTQLVR